MWNVGLPYRLHIDGSWLGILLHQSHINIVSKKRGKKKECKSRERRQGASEQPFVKGHGHIAVACYTGGRGAGCVFTNENILSHKCIQYLLQMFLLRIFNNRKERSRSVGWLQRGKGPQGARRAADNGPGSSISLTILGQPVSWERLFKGRSDYTSPYNRLLKIGSPTVQLSYSTWGP